MARYTLIFVTSGILCAGCLEYPPVGLWAALELGDVLKLLEVIIHTLCVALRLPSNKRFFHSEVCSITLRNVTENSVYIILCCDTYYHDACGGGQNAVLLRFECQICLL